MSGLDLAHHWARQNSLASRLSIMQNLTRLSAIFASVVTVIALLITAGALTAQTTASSATDAGKAPEPLSWTAQQDHKNMMEQLGIIRLRPGPSGQPGATNSANYDPAKVNPFPDLPEVLILKNGQKVTTAEMWWTQRRPEI